MKRGIQAKVHPFRSGIIILGTSQLGETVFLRQRKGTASGFTTHKPASRGLRIPPGDRAHGNPQCIRHFTLRGQRRIWQQYSRAYGLLYGIGNGDIPGGTVICLPAPLRRAFQHGVTKVR